MGIFLEGSNPPSSLKLSISSVSAISMSLSVSGSAPSFVCMGIALASALASVASDSFSFASCISVAVAARKVPDPSLLRRVRICAAGRVWIPITGRARRSTCTSGPRPRPRPRPERGIVKEDTGRMSNHGLRIAMRVQYIIVLLDMIVEYALRCVVLCCVGLRCVVLCWVVVCCVAVKLRCDCLFV